MKRIRVPDGQKIKCTLQPTEYQRFRCQGSVVEFKRGTTHSKVPCVVPRGVIDGFSAASRLRLLKFVAAIDWGTIPQSIFVTLTYPDEYCNRTYKERRQDRFLFMRKLEKHLGRKVCGIWRIEWMPRRSGKLKGLELPHYHLLIFGIQYIHYSLVNSWWKGVLHHTGYLRTEVKRAGSAKAAGIYVAKYMSKKTQRASLVNAAYLNNPGRHYGYHRPGLIPKHIETWIDQPTASQIEQLRSFANEVLPWLNKQHTGSWTLLGTLADQARELLAKIGLTTEGG